MEKTASAMWPATCGDSGPMSLPYSVDFYKGRGFSQALTVFGQQALLLGSTRPQPQDCRSLLNLLLLDAIGLTAAFPSNRQGMHPLIALEKSTLRRMNWDFPSCCRVFSEAVGILGLLDAIGLGAEEQLAAIQEEIRIAAGRDLDKTLSSF